jgi:hypothetical protein
MNQINVHARTLPEVVTSPGHEPLFKTGDRVRISVRYPVGHYRVPRYVRGKQALIEAIIEPASIDNEEEGYGRNAGIKLHYYRVGISLSDLWPGYVGSPEDGLRIEVYETWLERI